MPYLGLVQRLVDIAEADPRPRPDDDSITEADGETDGWFRVRGVDDPVDPRPDGDTITRATGECDQWESTKLFEDPRPSDDTITHQGAETDRWGSLPSNAAPPRPRPDDDTITFTQSEADSWTRG